MSNITLYGQPTCAICRVIKQQMDNKHIPYTYCDDTDVMVKLDITSVPVLIVDNKKMNAQEIMKWIKEWNNNND